MDHSSMSHGDTGHGMPMCQMSMVFTWNTQDLCIIFRSWHIRTTAGLLFSLLAVALLTAGYEALREASRRYEYYVDKRGENLPRPQNHLEDVTENTPFLWTGKAQIEVNRKAHVIKSILYGCQVFYSFFIMLLFMTYNGWVMIAVGVGASIGFLLFGKNTTAAKTASCH